GPPGRERRRRRALGLGRVNGWPERPRAPPGLPAAPHRVGADLGARHRPAQAEALAGHAGVRGLLDLELAVAVGVALAPGGLALGVEGPLLLGRHGILRGAPGARTRKPLRLSAAASASGGSLTVRRSGSPPPGSASPPAVRWARCRQVPGTASASGSRSNQRTWAVLTQRDCPSSEVSCRIMPAIGRPPPRSAGSRATGRRARAA